MRTVIICVCLCSCLFFSVSAVDPLDPAPVAVAELSGGYFFCADCALGKNVLFYVPVEFATGRLSLKGEDPFNMSNSSCVLFAPAFPDYQIQAGRFSGFTYRSDVGYDRYPLSVSKIQKTNIDFMDSSDGYIYPRDFFVILISSIILIGCLILLRRR